MSRVPARNRRRRSRGEIKSSFFTMERVQRRRCYRAAVAAGITRRVEISSGAHVMTLIKFDHSLSSNRQVFYYYRCYDCFRRPRAVGVAFSVLSPDGAPSSSLSHPAAAGYYLSSGAHRTRSENVSDERQRFNGVRKNVRVRRRSLRSLHRRCRTNVCGWTDRGTDDDDDGNRVKPVPARFLRLRRRRRRWPGMCTYETKRHANE